MIQTDKDYFYFLAQNKIKQQAGNSHHKKGQQMTIRPGQ